MICEGKFNFGVPAISNSTAATVSPYVFDAGSAKKLFDGVASSLKVVGNATLTADDNPTMRVQLVGSDAAALNSNNEVIGDTGVIAFGADGSTAIPTGTNVAFTIKPNRQFSPKRYYGLLFTLGGTNPDTAGTAGGVGQASVVLDAQSNDYNRRSATPA